MNRSIYPLPAWALVFLILSACSTMFKDEARIERDRVELEHSRALVFGASGAEFSPDGTQVAVGNRETIWVANTSTGRVTARLSYTNAARFGGSKSLEFIDSQRLIIGTQGAIMIWDLKEGLVTHRLPLSSRLHTPRAMAWSDSTQTLAYSSSASGSTIKTVPINTNGFGQAQDVPGFEGIPSDLLFSRDGRYLAASGDGAGVYVREVATGEGAGELPTEGYVSSLELFGNNKLLASGANLAVWTFLSDQEAQEFENPSLQAQIDGQIAARVAGGIALGALAVVLWAPAVFSGSGEYFEFMGQAGYALATEPLKTSQQAWCGRSSSVSPDGRWLADIYPGISKEIIGVYDMTTGELIRKLNPKGEYSCVVKFNPNGKQLLITSTKAASLYDTATWKHHNLDLGKPR
jgi:WD40 repeat protein